jgi:hypothetical protein
VEHSGVLVHSAELSYVMNSRTHTITKLVRNLIYRVLRNSFILYFKLQLHVVLYHKKLRKNLSLFMKINI